MNIDFGDFMGAAQGDEEEDEEEDIDEDGADGSDDDDVGNDGSDMQFFEPELSQDLAVRFGHTTIDSVVSAVA
jgi:hypothetical protein